MIVSTLANCYRDSQKHPESFHPWDFFSNLKELETIPTEQEQAEAFMRLMGHPGTKNE